MKITPVLTSFYTSPPNRRPAQKQAQSNPVLLTSTRPSFVNFTAQVNFDNNYDEWFKTYLKYTDEKASIANAVSGVITSSDFYENLKNKSCIKVLDIGCGNGVLTRKVLNGIAGIFPHKPVVADAFDVNTKLLTDCRCSCSNLNPDVQINIQKRDYFNDGTINGKYDIILASHVMYYTDDIPGALLKIRSNLSDNGKAIIVHHSGDGCILSHFRAKYNPSSAANLNQSEKEIASEDIIASALDNQKIAYSVGKQNFVLKMPDNRKDVKNLVSFIIDKPFEKLQREQKAGEVIKDISANLDGENCLHLFNNMYVIDGTEKSSGITFTGAAKDIQAVSRNFKNKIKIVFSDVDGTLSPHSDLLSEKTIGAVDFLHERKVPVILTTARCYKDTLPIIEQFARKPDFTIALQGGEIIDKNGAAVMENKIPENAGKKLVEWFKSFSTNDKNIHLIMYFDDEAYSLSGIQFPWKARALINQTANFDELFAESKAFQKALLYKTDEKKGSDVKDFILSDFKRAGIGDLSMKISGTGFYELQNSHVSKDKAIKFILDKLGLDAKSAIAIGDSANDIEMLDFVRKNKGLAVVMGDASEDVISHASAVTAGIEEDGFARAIDLLF